MLKVVHLKLFYAGRSKLCAYITVQFVCFSSTDYSSDTCKKKFQIYFQSYFHSKFFQPRQLINSPSVSGEGFRCHEKETEKPPCVLIFSKRHERLKHTGKRRLVIHLLNNIASLFYENKQWKLFIMILTVWDIRAWVMELFYSLRELSMYQTLMNVFKPWSDETKRHSKLNNKVK